MVWRGASKMHGLVRQRFASEDRVDDGTGAVGRTAIVPAARGRVPGGAGQRSRETVPGGPGPSGPAPGGSGEVPRWLRTAAAWAWRILLLAGALYIIARVAAVLYIVVVPCAAALLLTALLQPLAARLRRRGWPPLAATWCTLLGAIVLLAGATALATARVQAEYPALLAQLRHTTAQIQSWLSGPPFHLKTGNLDKASGGIVKYISQHQSLVEGTVVTGGRIAVEVLAGVVLTLFVAFFLIKDGRKIWVWLIHRAQPQNKLRIDRAGRSAWQAVVYYVRGTVVVAAIHAVVMGSTLSIMSAPLAVPLALFMFLAAFVPLVGVLLAGGLAILVTLAAKGWLEAVIVLGVLVVMNQLEGHLLQPQIVGKMVRLHPLAVILVLAVGGVVAGIAGAVVAVPITAALARAIPELRAGGEGEDGAAGADALNPPAGADAGPAGDSDRQELG